METKGLGAGSYPDAPEEIEMKTVEVQCSFKTYIQVPVNCEDQVQYILDNYDKYDLLEEVDYINLEDVL